MNVYNIVWADDQIDELSMPLLKISKKVLWLGVKRRNIQP